MRILLTFLCFLMTASSATADTIDNYVNISNDIPKMEIKADPESQAWARSARHVLGVADETILETLLQANEIAKQHGKPLFCLPKNITLNSSVLNEIILETYQGISSQQSDKNKMTVSQVAWLGVTKKYPCENKKDDSPNSIFNNLRPE